jgi:hypothetical protein
MAADFERGGSKLYAALARSYADDPLVAEIVGDHEPRWEAPLRLFGGVHYLELSGVVKQPWPKFRGVLEAYRDWLVRFVAEQPVQTNEVQRSWALLPAFLTVARTVARPLDLIELGPSAGLNLMWDRYRYEYASGSWGSRRARIRLAGEDRVPPPSDLLATRPAVRKRTGIDRRPIDVTSAHGAHLLQAFVWADQTHRLDRVRAAIEVVREDPPELLQDDYVEVLPALLAQRADDAVTIVFETASRLYLAPEARERLRAGVDAAGAAGPLVWIATRTRDEDEEDGDGYALELAVWPGGERRVVARFGYHGEWLAWRT